MAKNDKTESPVENFNPVIPAGMKEIDFSKWSDEQVSFAPYWTPAEGKFFVGVLTDVDMRDPKFIRYQFAATYDTPCQRGPGDENSARHEKVMVKAGEKFSISLYSGLKDVFDDYVNAPFPVQVRVDAKRKVKTSEGQDFWEFRARVSEETKKLLLKFRETKRIAAKSDNRPALES